MNGARVGLFLLLVAASGWAWGQRTVQKLPSDWTRSVNEAMHRPHPRTGTIYFLSPGESSPTWVTPYRCLPMEKPYELLQTVGAFVRRVPEPGTAHWASPPAFTENADAFMVSRWSDTCRSGNTPLELAYYRWDDHGEVCLEGQCYSLDTVLGWPHWNSVQFPFYHLRTQRWVFSARVHSEDPLSLYSWSPGDSNVAQILAAPNPQTSLIYPTYWGDTLWFSSTTSPQEIQLEGRYRGQAVPRPAELPTGKKVFNLQPWGPDSIAVNIWSDARQGTDLVVLSKTRPRQVTLTYLPQYTAYFGSFPSGEEALAEVQRLREKYEFRGLFIQKTGGVYRVETPIELNYKELEYQAAALAQTHPQAKLLENGYTESTEWIPFGFVPGKAALSAAGKLALEAFHKNHPQDSGHLEMHIYFPHEGDFLTSMNLGVERARVVEKWMIRNGWNTAELSVRSSDPATEWCPTQDTCRGQRVGHWGRLVFVPKSFKRTELYTAEEASKRIKSQEVAVPVRWALPRYALEIAAFDRPELARDRANEWIRKDPNLQVEIVPRNGLWHLELPVQGDEENARFFQNIFHQRGFEDVVWLDYGTERTGKRVSLHHPAPSGTSIANDSILWLGPTYPKNTAGFIPGRSDWNETRIHRSSWDPLASLCDEPGRCADGWQTGRYAIQMPQYLPVRTSARVVSQVREERTFYPLPDAAPHWWMILDSAQSLSDAWTRQAMLARKNESAAQWSVFNTERGWGLGYWGWGDPATGEALASVVIESYPQLKFGFSKRPYRGELEVRLRDDWSATAAELIEWRQAHPSLSARLVVYGSSPSSPTTDAAWIQIHQSVEERCAALGIPGFLWDFERVDPHADACASGCNHLNPPYQRAVIGIQIP